MGTESPWCRGASGAIHLFSGRAVVASMLSLVDRGSGNRWRDKEAAKISLVCLGSEPGLERKGGSLGCLDLLFAVPHTDAKRRFAAIDAIGSK